MTCEVAVMNRYAVVLAADSAVTSSDRDGNRRYSKGGNKVFQLSSFDPVGVMIFSNAGLHGLPWEVIIKAYRAQLKRNAFRVLSEYAIDFIAYIKDPTHFFSLEELDREHQSHVYITAARLLRTFIGQLETTVEPDDTDKEFRVAWLKFCSDTNTDLDAREWSPCIPPETLDSSIAPREASSLWPELERLLSQNDMSAIIETLELWELAHKFFLKRYDDVLTDTGLVFSGYGMDQYFPSALEYRVHGFVGSHLVYRETKCSEISSNRVSDVLQFAMTSEVDAFTKGVSFEAFLGVKKAYEKHVDVFTDQILQKINGVRPDDYEALKTQSVDAFTSEWFGPIQRQHLGAMKDGIATLPVEEMCHLAETLVVLQSLKERMTLPSQSVGGPIDIAVITKAEGLVWVKRKHFFNSDRNLGYVMRQKAVFDHQGQDHGQN